MTVSYILPIRVSAPADAELGVYLSWLSTEVELLVVDGSAPAVFEAHAKAWAGLDLTHVAPDDVCECVNGKVAGVLSGLRRASQEFVIIADDDVRYDAAGIRAVEQHLIRAHVVRPQNYFEPLPWHACLDTARTLLNRLSGGDWPGTMGVRRATLIATGGYDGNVLFENLELVRTVQAAGGSEACPLGLYVRRMPPSSSHFLSQRVRQAYDEFARPARMAIWLAVIPLCAMALAARPRLLPAAAAAIVAAAEVGRRRAGGARVFPWIASAIAPIWVCERAVCAWLALGAHLLWGGVPYHGRIVATAATPLSTLRQRFKVA